MRLLTSLPSERLKLLPPLFSLNKRLPLRHLLLNLKMPLQILEILEILLVILVNLMILLVMFLLRLMKPLHKLLLSLPHNRKHIRLNLKLSWLKPLQMP